MFFAARGVGLTFNWVQCLPVCVFLRRVLLLLCGTLRFKWSFLDLLTCCNAMVRREWATQIVHLCICSQKAQLLGSYFKSRQSCLCALWGQGALGYCCRCHAVQRLHLVPASSRAATAHICAKHGRLKLFASLRIFLKIKLFLLFGALCCGVRPNAAGFHW